MRKYFLYGLFLIAGTLPAQSFTTSIELCRQKVQEVQRTQNLAGLAVAVSVNDHLVWSEGFGYADLENLVPIKPSSSLFRIGSISKTLTAAGMAKLFEAKRLDLDAPITQYYPGFPPKSSPITIRQVGGHIAGIRHYQGLEFLGTKRFDDVASALTIFENDPLLFTPGEKYSYSSYGWNLLSYILEKITLQPFLDYMHQEVFLPLKMDHTLPDFHEQITPGRVRFYQDYKGKLSNCPVVDNSYKWAGGGFLSTAEDLITFGEAYLFDRICSNETSEEFTKSQKTNDGELTGYGIGWRISRDQFGRKWVGHGGGSVGGVSMLQIYPEQKVVVVVLTNMSQANIADLTSEIANVFIDGN